MNNTDRCIIFDCDGVLIDSEVIYNSVERKHLSRIGLTYEHADYQYRFTGLTEADFLAELKRDYQCLGKGAFPSDFARQVKTECRKRFKTELVAIDGIYTVLEQFDRPAAVASSSPVDDLHEKLRITKLFEYFAPHIYSGDQVESGKPSPDLFLFAANRLGQEPENCIVVEDSINGVRAGLAAGMTVWGFTGGSHTDAELPDRLRQAGAHAVFSSCTELRSII